jgi:hypothetical protein
MTGQGEPEAAPEATRHGPHPEIMKSQVNERARDVDVCGTFADIDPEQVKSTATRRTSAAA